MIRLMMEWWDVIQLIIQLACVYFYCSFLYKRLGVLWKNYEYQDKILMRQMTGHVRWLCVLLTMLLTACLTHVIKQDIKDIEMMWLGIVVLYLAINTSVNSWFSK